MKRINYIALSAAVLLLAVSCQKDNYPAPDGGIYGNIVDAQTGEPIPLPVEGSTGAAINLMEVGTNATQPVGFYARQDGSFANTKVFNGRYSVTARGPFEVQGAFEAVVDGQTRLDITAVPYSRITAAAETEGKVITIDYTAEAADASNTISQVTAYWDYRMQIDDQTGHYAGKKTNFAGDKSGSFSFNLESESQYNQNRHKIEANGNRVYVRVSAKVGENLNYSKVIEIQL